MASKSAQKSRAARDRERALQTKRAAQTAAILLAKQSADLARLATDIETATPHQTPTWADPMTDAEYRAVCDAAEQLAAERQRMTQAMRSPNY